MTLAIFPLCGATTHRIEWICARIRFRKDGGRYIDQSRDGAYHRGNLEEAIRRWTDALEYFDTPEQKAILLNCLGSAENDMGDFAATLNYSETALGIWKRLDSRKGMADSLSGLASAQFGLGNPVARTSIDEAIGLYQQIGDRRGGKCVPMSLRDCDSETKTCSQRSLISNLAFPFPLKPTIRFQSKIDVLIHYHALSGNTERAVAIWSGCESHRTKRQSAPCL